MTAIEFRGVSDADAPELLRLHNRAFVAQWDSAWWSWRYSDLPRGEAAILGAFREDGRCVGMYAGARLALWIQGETTFALSQSDVSVDSELRGGPGRAKLVTRMAKRFFAEHTGGSTQLTYGFPVPPLRRVISRFVGGQILCDVVFLVNELHAGPPAVDPREIDVRAVNRFDEETDDLWERERERFPAALVRDSTYLNWRYAEHPLAYELLEARDAATGRLRGVAVVREGGIDPSVSSLSDWLVPLEDLAAESALLERAKAYARGCGSTALVAWFASMGAHFQRFQIRHGFFARATAHQEQFSAWRDGVDRDWLQANWYQTMGDIDFF